MQIVKWISFIFALEALMKGGTAYVEVSVKDGNIIVSLLEISVTSAKVTYPLQY